MTDPKNNVPPPFPSDLLQPPKTKIRFSWKGVFATFIPPTLGIIIMLFGYSFDIVILAFIGGIIALGGFVAMFALGIYIFALQTLPEDVYRKSLQASIEYTELVKKLAEERKRKQADMNNDEKTEPRNQHP